MSNVELPVWYGTTPRQRAASVWDHLKVLTIEPGECTAPPMPKRTSRLTIMPSAAKPRRKRKPTLATVAKQASKAAIKVARYEVKPDGTVVIVPGKPDQGEAQPEQTDLDKWLAKRHAN
jgi:hypothetical protein